MFVTNEGSNNVSLISDRTNAVVATIPVGHQPEAVVYDSGKAEVLVANAGSNTVGFLANESSSPGGGSAPGLAGPDGYAIGGGIGVAPAC